MKVQIGSTLVIGTATATAVFFEALPPPPRIKIVRTIEVKDEEDQRLEALQRQIEAIAERNRAANEKITRDREAARLAYHRSRSQREMDLAFDHTPPQSPKHRGSRGGGGGGGGRDGNGDRARDRDGDEEFDFEVGGDASEVENDGNEDDEQRRPVFDTNDFRRDVSQGREASHNDAERFSERGEGQVPPSAGKEKIAGSTPKADVGGDPVAKRNIGGGDAGPTDEKETRGYDVVTEGTAANGALGALISTSVDETDVDETTNVAGVTAAIDDDESKEGLSEENEDGPAEVGSKGRKRKKKKVDANLGNTGVGVGKQGVEQGTDGADTNGDDPGAVSAVDAPAAPTLAGADVGSSLMSIQEVPEPPPSPALTPTASPQVAVGEDPPSPMSLATSPRSESGEEGMGGEGKEGGESKEGFFSAVGSAAAAATAAATSATAAATSLASAAKKSFRDKKKKDKTSEGKEEEKSKETGGNADRTEHVDGAVADGGSSAEAGAGDGARADCGVDIGVMDSADAAATADPKDYVGAPPTRQQLRMKKRTSFSSEATDGTSSEGSRSSSSTSSSSSSSSSSSEEEDDDAMGAVDVVGVLDAATNAVTDTASVSLAGGMESGDEATLTAASLAANEARPVSTQEGVAGAVASSDGSDGPSGTIVAAHTSTGANTANLSAATTTSTPNVSADDVGDSLDTPRSSLRGESSRNVPISRTSSDEPVSRAMAGRLHSEQLSSFSPRDRERMMYNMSPAGKQKLTSPVDTPESISKLAVGLIHSQHTQETSNLVRRTATIAWMLWMSKAIIAVTTRTPRGATAILI